MQASINNSILTDVNIALSNESVDLCCYKMYVTIVILNCKSIEYYLR